MRRSQRRHMSTGGRHLDVPRQPSAKHIILWLVAHDDGLQMNNGKMLDFSLSRRRHWIGRDRSVGDHHLVEVRGNRIRAFVGECQWPDGRRSAFVKHQLVLDMPQSEYRDFLPRYRQATPQLEWWN